MKSKRIISAICIVCLSVCVANAQTEKASDNVKAWKVANCTIPYDINYEGEPFRIKWGMDTAWDSEENVRRGIAFIGKQQIELARASFNPNLDLTSAGELSSGHISALKSRLNHIGLIGKHVEILLNDDPVDSKIMSMYQNDPKKWAQLFDKTVEYAQNLGFKVVGIAPFNEPDYGWGQDYGSGAKVNFLNICKAVRSGDFPRLDTIRLCGGNTLNDDKALEWYNYLKTYLEEGNTHQLAGSFDNYANFFTQVKADGKIGTADELHNIMEAMVGVQYGMTQGIWWGFDGLARGEFCRASFGDRLAYGEDRTNWTAGSVYRNTLDNRYEAFVGTSERQANKSSYLFVSTDRDVYYDGQGPQREFLVQTPGGTGYQQGQTNAERVVNITFGEDVQPFAINGTYIFMNKATQMVLGTKNGGSSNGTSLVQGKNVGKNYQQWIVTPLDSAHGGDFSYYMMKGVASNKYPNVWNWSLSNGGAVNLYNDDGVGNNEQWWFEYDGDGYYYVHSKHSNLVLGISGTSAGASITQQTKGKTESAQSRQLWRLMPVDAECELEAPVSPTGLKATPLNASILLSWNANSEDDIDGYTILRRPKGGEWNTIARCVKGTGFLDNLCIQGVEYEYKIKAVDRSVNTSECSESITAQTLDEKTMIMRLEFEKDLCDWSENHFDAAHYGATAYSTVSALRKSGNSSLSLDGNKYVQLPYSVGDMKEMSVAMWVKIGNTSATWARLFDFGNGTNQYMFLTTNSGSDMRLVMKNNGAEEILSTKKIANLSWHHIAVTLGEKTVSLYLDGELVAETEEMKIRPSDFHPAMCYLGRSQYVADPLLKAYFDDVRIYNYALSAGEVESIMDEATGIEDLIAEDNDAPVINGKIYNLAGQIVDENYKGIVIVNGKKMLLR